MDLQIYQQQAKRTDAPLSDGYSRLHAVHMCMGIVTEAGELLDIYKKNLAYNKPIDVANEKEEIGDLMWYIANHCTNRGFDLNEILATNIAKLKARFPHKFTEEKAQNRDLAAERQILER